MRRKGYRGVGCVKRSLSKCEGICRTYDRIQTTFASSLQEDEDVMTFQCNVLIDSGEENAQMYSLTVLCNVVNELH